ncbi:pilus assembly protein N-terminal domain-containing protein [Silvanigrella aquatica]|uniref:Type II/III secretion system secretin-like domain-containing protein n=1 Tax=Silvanigrella aquatica TaxID=1915309 RepID=A0A1L4D1I9_9BACT|nr:pilus assembly protein N-terminal domain-containing protein [Silvanigrella aquatica]APJ04075.1 hypothetical protein AXG55_09215 [Silvanigrella aquatica]
MKLVIQKQIKQALLILSQPIKSAYFLNAEKESFKIHLLFPRGNFARSTGLLNHFNLPINNGIIYSNKYFFHTFNMNFSIAVFCFDKKKNLICLPKIISKNCLFIVPFGTKYISEVNSEILHYYSFERQIMPTNKKVRVFESEFLKIFVNFKLIYSLLFVLLAFLFITSAYSQDNLKLSIGREKTLDLGSAPQTIQISDPDVVEVQRIGVSNSIKMIPKQNGVSLITIAYPNGEQNKWHIQVGNENFDFNNHINFMNQDFKSDSASPSLITISRPLKSIHGIHTQIKNGKIIILGNLDTIEDFRLLVNAVAAHSNSFFPAFSYSKKIENEVIKSVQSDLKLFGEKNLKIINRGGLYTLTGVPTSPLGKQRAWQFLSALIPQIFDATSTMSGESTVVQVNLEFIEVGKSEHLGVGFQQPGMNQALSGTLNFAPSVLSSSLAQPSLQIAPLTSLLKALQERAFARNLAKPVVITRSGEKASFLAGGEVPIVSTSSSTIGNSSSVTFKPFGILFHVTPNVQNDGSIWLKLDLEVSDIADSLSYQNVPGFTTRKINTNIVLKDKNYAILSGLVQTKNSKSVEKFPILGSIPIIGELFKSRKFKDAETELWVAVSAIRDDLMDEDRDVKKLIDNKFSSYKKLISGDLLD